MRTRSFRGKGGASSARGRRTFARQSDNQYRIPTPAEDDWEHARSQLIAETKRRQSPLSGGPGRVLAAETGAHAPGHTKTFKAGLAIAGRQPVEDGDSMFQVYLADDAKAAEELARELRGRSQRERKDVFWAVGITNAIDAETVEVFRSKEMLARKEREARTGEETRLIGEEKVRLRTHQEELPAPVACGLPHRRRLLPWKRPQPERSCDGRRQGRRRESSRTCCPTCSISLRRAPPKPLTPRRAPMRSSPPTASKAFRPSSPTSGCCARRRARRCSRPTRVRSRDVLRLIRGLCKLRRGGKREVPDRRARKGALRLGLRGRATVVLALLRAGKIEATSKGQTIDSATSPEAKEAFGSNNPFRATSFRPKRGIEFEQIVQAASAFQDTFGTEAKELNASAVVTALREELIDFVTSP